MLLFLSFVLSYRHPDLRVLAGRALHFLCRLDHDLSFARIDRSRLVCKNSEHCRRDECRNDGRHRLSSVNCGDCSIEGRGKTADGVKGGFRVVNGVANGMHFL